MLRTRTLAAAFALSLTSLFAGPAGAQSAAQLRPQLPPSLPHTFVPPRGAPAAPPSAGPAVYPFVIPVGGSFRNGAVGGVVTRQGQSATVYGGPGYGGFQFSTRTNIGGR